MGGTRAVFTGASAYRVRRAGSQSRAAADFFGVAMLSRMASQWKTFQHILKSTENLVFNEAPKFIRGLQNPATVQRVIQQGIMMGIEALVAGALPAPRRWRSPRGGW